MQSTIPVSNGRLSADFMIGSQSFEDFLSDMGADSSRRMHNYFEKLTNCLSVINNQPISSHEKNEFLRRLAFTVFNRPRLLKAHTSLNEDPMLIILRILIFHNFEQVDITTKILLTAYNTRCQKEEQQRERPENILSSIINTFFRSHHSVKIPYKSDLASEITKIYTGTGKHYFDLLSQGKCQGYLLDDYESLGIFASSVDGSKTDSERHDRTRYYACRAATACFDYPIYVEMDIPTKYLSHVYMQHGRFYGIERGHYNKYEPVILQSDLEKLRKNEVIDGTVFEYSRFKVSAPFNPFTQYNEGVFTPSVLGLTEEEFSQVEEYVTTHLAQDVEIPKPVQQFRFGQSLVETLDSSAAIANLDDPVIQTGQNNP